MKWYKKSLWQSVMMLATGVIMVIALGGLNYLVSFGEVTDAAQQNTPLEKDQYNGHGLPIGEEASIIPIYQDDSLAIFSDRILQLFNPADQSAQRAIDNTQGLRSHFASDIPFYFMPIPPHSVVEGYEKQREKYIEFSDNLKGALSKDIEYVDVLPTLLAYSNQYLYFRTEESWTGRAAYYASAQLCERLGINPIPLSEYNEYMFKSLTGALQSSLQASTIIDMNVKSVIEQIPTDKVYYYTLPDAANRTQVLYYNDDTLLTYKKPTIVRSGTGRTTFVGSNYELAIVEGDSKDNDKKDKSILLLCAGDGRMLAPYLANYYKNVYVVNISNYHNFLQEIDKFKEKYSFEAVIFAPTADEISNQGKSKLLDNMVQNMHKERESNG